MIPQTHKPRLILASASASRRGLLAGAGLKFEVAPADIDEAAVKRTARTEGVSAAAAALRLADLKAAEISRRAPGALVIGADQILVCDDVWFDKPVDVVAAREQLRVLRGRRHMLATAVVCCRDGQQAWHHLAQPSLIMRDFSDEFVELYLLAEKEAVTSTVGAYRLESQGIQLFDHIEGDYFAILGLPLLPLLAFLRAINLLSE